MIKQFLTVCMICAALPLLSQQIGKASWYGNHFHGKKTSSGSIFNQWGMTCASNTHKMGTHLKVTNLENGKAVIVRVTDTGGFTKLGRIIDLSKGAFQKLAPLSRGIIKVLVEKVDYQKGHLNKLLH